MIRLILIILFLIVFFLLSIPVYLFEWILGKFNMDLRNRSSYFIVRYAFKIVLFISGAHVTVKGVENIPKDKSVLYVGKHNSFYPYFMFGDTIPDRICCQKGNQKSSVSESLDVLHQLYIYRQKKYT